MSPAFEDNGQIPRKYTCDAENISPPLKVVSPLDEAKSLVLIMDDPDAPGGTFTHWTVWNIDPKIDVIKEGIVPKGMAEGINSFGEIGYGGPCPPFGTHRYFFKLYALDTVLELPTGASREELEQMMSNHILTEAQLMGTYSRQ